MNSEYVTQEECRNKIHIPKWVLVLFFSIFFSLMSIFLVLVGFSASEASAATSKIQDTLRETEVVANALMVHVQVGREKEKAILEKLEDIRNELSLQRTEQQLVYKQLLERNSTDNND